MTEKDIMFIIIILVLAIILILDIRHDIFVERKKFNNGVCPRCGKQLKLFNMNSHGGRRYYCDNCNYYTWVNYNRVDKDYNINKN